MKRLLNVRKDAPDSRDHLAAPSLATPPRFISLAGNLGPVKDQGQLGSCTAHAGTGLREYLYRTFYQWEKDKTTAPGLFRLSPLFLYQMERQLEGSFGKDEGADSRTIFKALTQYGCLLEQDDPYIEGNAETAVSGSNIMSKALPYQHISYHRILDVATLKTVLASGYVATVGMPLFESFESDRTADTGRVSTPTVDEQSIGGHEMLVWGYNEDGRFFMVRNSWGTSWGSQGNCYVPYDYFAMDGVMDQTDFWTAHLGKPWIAKK